MPDFEIDVLSNPVAALSIDKPLWDIGDFSIYSEYDIDLIKPALLFSDRVNLFTFRETMRQITYNQGATIARMPMMRIMSYLGVAIRRDPREIELLGLNPSDLPSAAEAEALTDGDAMNERFGDFWDNNEERIESYADKVIQVWRQRYRELEAPGLHAAVDSGLLKVDGWLTIPPEYQNRPIMPDEIFEASIEAFLDRLVNSSRQPMLDVGADWVAKNWPLDTDRTRSTEQRAASWHGPTITAANAVMRLPGLERLSLEEVIDLRSELVQYLPAFRSEMIRLGEDLDESNIEPDDLAVEIDRRWYRDISPVLEEIQRDVAEAAYPRRLLNTITAQKDAMISAGGAVVLATGSVAAGISTLAPAALAAAYPLAKALNDHISNRAAVKKNRLYLLYALEKGIKKRLG
jgi:hypothetical protein